MQSPSQYQPTRSGQDRRNGQDRRVGDRRRRFAAVASERREEQRRAGDDRRRGADRRRSWVGGKPVAGVQTAAAQPATLSARDRTKARMLPDEFVQATGDTPDRLAKVIRRQWANAPRQVRAGLADGLQPIVDPLRHGAPVTEAVRDACQSVVTTWLAPFHRP